MKDWRNYAVILFVFLLFVASFVACEKQKQLEEIQSKNNDAKLLSDIAVLQSHIKEKDKEAVHRLKVMDSLRISNEELRRKQKERGDVSQVKPSKTLHVPKGFIATEEDIGQYVSSEDWQTQQTTCADIQNDLKKCLHNSAIADSTFRAEVKGQASKDSSQNKIITKLDTALTNKTKQVDVLGKKVRRHKVGNYVLGALAFVLLILQLGG